MFTANDDTTNSQWLRFFAHSLLGMSPRAAETARDLTTAQDSTQTVAYDQSANWKVPRSAQSKPVSYSVVPRASLIRSAIANGAYNTRKKSNARPCICRR